MHVSVPLRQSRGPVGHDLATQDVPEEAEGVVQLLVVDALVEVLDEDVPGAGPPEGGIPLTPHDTAGFALDVGVIHRVEGTLGVVRLVVVDVGVSQRSAGDGVAADADGSDGTDGVEYLEE